MSFTPANVATIRKRNAIPAHQGGTGHDEDGEVMSVHQAAAELGITASTLYRWVNDGFVPGEQITPGAPWRIRLTDSIHALVADDAPPDGSPSRSPPPPSASPGRPCCSVSSAATSAPSTSAPDAGKACVSSYPLPKTACSNHPPTVKEQCDDQSITSTTRRSTRTGPKSEPVHRSSWPPPRNIVMSLLRLAGCETSPAAPSTCPDASITSWHFWASYRNRSESRRCPRSDFADHPGGRPTYVYIRCRGNYWLY